MTQLFDTANYDFNDRPGRHLRSIAAGTSAPRADRGPLWRLDEQTIATGRKGIELAREALRNSSTESQAPERRAA